MNYVVYEWQKTERQLDKKPMTAKERHKKTILEYLANPNNEMPRREDLASVCGLKRGSLYFHFSPEELSEFEAQGLEMRRRKYAPRLSKVDIAILDRAASGDPQAAKLAYQRFEGWSEKQQVDHSNSDGSMRPTIIEVVPGDKSDD